MKNFKNLSNEEICNYILNNKKADCMELSAKEELKEGLNPKTGFTTRIVYKDKHVTIAYSYMELDEDDILQNFFIVSNWWGRIKNSYFTIDGERGKFGYVRCGVFSPDELKPFKTRDHVPVNNRNEKVDIEVNDFASLVLYCQRKYKASPSYEVLEVLSLSPNPLVRIKVRMPDGKLYLQEGTSKKHAANLFAQSGAWK